MHRLAAAVAAGTLAASVAAAVPAGSAATSPVRDDRAAAAGPTGPAVDLRPGYRCADTVFTLTNAVCGYLTVPVDHARPKGATMRLAMSYLPATAPKERQLGMLVVNPGGPGAPGLLWSAAAADLLGPAIASRYDIVGLDLRGIGAGKPRLQCDPDYKLGPRPDYVPDGPASGPVTRNEKAWLAKVKAYVGTCAKKYPELLRHMTTTDDARDLEVLRRGFHADKISYLGFSWGGYLGQVYATLFPGRVRRMVLDGVPDPRLAWYDMQLAQDRGFEFTIGRFFAWVAAHDATYRLGRTGAAVRARYQKVQDALRRRPVGRVGPAEWTDVFLQAAYYRRTWPEIARGFREWTGGDHATLTGIWNSRAYVGVDTGTVMYLASTCTDAPWPRDYATWRKDAFATAKVAPFETWGNVWDNAGCLFWPVKGRTPVKVGSAKAPPILLVAATRDGATPYRGALEARRRFPSARLVAELDGITHTTLGTGNDCVDRFVADYLAEGRLRARVKADRADVLCEATPPPRP